jgi:hypothetical protein
VFDNLDVGIKRRHLLGGGINFVAAHVLGEVNHLALQVREIDHVEIHQADPPDAGGSQIEAKRRAEATGADQQHFGALEFQLAFHPHLGDDQVARIALNFVFRKRQLVPPGIPPAMEGTRDSVSASAAGVASLPR